MTQQEYISLVNEANKHSYLYYVESNPAISDAEFDAMLVEIDKYEQAHPEHILPDSPTQCVGSDINGNGRRLIAHRSPMLSQDKAHNIDEIKDFVASVEKVLGYTPVMRVEWKLDGVSCSIVYIDGRLVSASTRGDGNKGQDITDHVMAMASVPNVISQSGRVEVRGEVVCPKGQHVALGYKDERTAASAILNASYGDSAKALVFVPWEVLGDSYNTFSDVSKLAVEFSNVVAGYTVNGLQAIEETISRLSANHPADYPVDGLVVKIDNRREFSKMGANQHHPKGSIAYKFEAATAITTVRSIEIKVAKSGRRTPVAHLVPVVILGRDVKKVNLFSEKTMNDLGVVAGSRVRVELRHDVNPKIVEVFSDAPVADNAPLMPTPSPSINRSASAPSRPFVRHEPEDEMPTGYWEKKKERLNKNTLSMLRKLEAKKKADAKHDAIPMLSHPARLSSTLYLPDREEVENEQREEAMQEEEQQQRNKLSKGFKIMAAVGAVVAVAALFVVGVGMAAFFLPLLAGAFVK